MKKNILKIHIARPVEEVFKFTTDSSKIALWFDSIAEEIPSETPWKLGTILRNRGENSDKWNECEITEFVPNKKFTLSQIGGDYKVRYIYIDRFLAVPNSLMMNGWKMVSWKVSCRRAFWKNLNLSWKTKNQRGVIYE